MKSNIRTRIAACLCLVALITVFTGGLTLWFGVPQVAVKDAVYADKVKYIAHRGLSSAYYQNTALAFEEAAKSEFFYGIETDVWLTKDGKWVCCHDKNPFTDSSIIITETDYADALNLPLSPEKAGENICTVSDVYLCDFATYLSICKTYNKVSVIEIKYKASKADLQSLLSATAQQTDVETVQYISFHKEVIDALISINGKLTVQLLMNREAYALFGMARGYHLGLRKDLISPVIVKTLHSKKRYLNVWTVNDKKEAERLAELGVDFITTDYIF